MTLYTHELVLYPYVIFGVYYDYLDAYAPIEQRIRQISERLGVQEYYKTSRDISVYLQGYCFYALCFFYKLKLEHLRLIDNELFEQHGRQYKIIFYTNFPCCTADLSTSQLKRFPTLCSSEFLPPKSISWMADNIIDEQTHVIKRLLDGGYELWLIDAVFYDTDNGAPAEFAALELRSGKSEHYIVGLEPFEFIEIDCGLDGQTGISLAEFKVKLYGYQNRVLFVRDRRKLSIFLYLVFGSQDEVLEIDILIDLLQASGYCRRYAPTCGYHQKTYNGKPVCAYQNVIYYKSLSSLLGAKND